MHTRVSNAGARRGGVLVMSLVAVGIVASLSVAFLRISADVTRRQVGASDTKLAFYLAEAGLAESYAGIMVGRTGAVGSEAEPAVLGEGLVWVDATALDAEHVRLEAVGMARSGKAKLGMVVRRGQTNVGGLGFFSEQDVSVGDGSLIDGYDSTDGTYADQAAADPDSVKQGSLGSNGNVTVTSGAAGTAIHGDVNIGPAGSLTLNGSPTITGDTTTALSLIQLDAVTPPATPLVSGITWLSGTPLVVPSGTYGASFLHLEPNSEVVLQGPLTLVLDGLTAAAGAELTFDTTGGEIVVFVGTELDLDGASVLTQTDADATKVTVNVVGAAAVDLSSAGEFHGLVYAPEAAVNVGSGFELFGGLVAEQLTIADGAALHHDRALLASGADDAIPKVLSWQILELPEDARDGLNVDPFAVLGVDPTTCPPPHLAHEDQMLGIIYIDSGGFTQTYSGLESGFDWGLVRVVVEVKRTGGMVTEDLLRLAGDGALGFLIP